MQPQVKNGWGFCPKGYKVFTGLMYLHAETVIQQDKTYVLKSEFKWYIKKYSYCPKAFFDGLNDKYTIYKPHFLLRIS